MADKPEMSEAARLVEDFEYAALSAIAGVGKIERAIKAKAALLAHVEALADAVRERDELRRAIESELTMLDSTLSSFAGPREAIHAAIN